jgi:hypothetical protein
MVVFANQVINLSSDLPAAEPVFSAIIYEPEINIFAM